MAEWNQKRVWRVTKGALILFLGVGIMFLSAVKSRAIWNARFWPHVEGKVVSSKVVFHPNQPRTERQPFWEPIVEYEYSVSKTKFTSTRIDFGPVREMTKQEAENIIATQYPNGKSVNVYYSPKALHLSVLKREWPYQLLILMLCGLIALFAGAKEIHGAIKGEENPQENDSDSPDFRKA